MGGFDAPALPAPPSVISGRWTTLRAVSRDDYPSFFKWRSDVFDLHIWAASKRVPTAEEFGGEIEQLLRQSITFVVVNNRDAVSIGFVQAYNLNFAEGWCYALVYTERGHRRGHGAEAYVALLDYLFRSFSLRKVYADVYEFNIESMKPLTSGGFVEEGRLKHHTWFNDRYWDVIRLAMYREDWYRFRERTHFVLGIAQDAEEMIARQTASAANGRPLTE